MEFGAIPRRDDWGSVLRENRDEPGVGEEDVR